MSSTNHRHLLRLSLSCRKLTAQVTNSGTDSIVAMASSTEQEFIPHYRSKLTTFPRPHRLWDANIASRIGEKLGFRLNHIGISHIEIEQLSLPIRYRKMIVPLLHSVRSAGITVAGSEKTLELLEEKIPEEHSLPIHYRKMVVPFLPSVEALELASLVQKTGITVVK